MPTLWLGAEETVGLHPQPDLACDQGGQPFLPLVPRKPSFLLFQVLKPFLEDSKYQNLLPLFVGHNFLLVSEEPKVKEMVRVLKGVPFLPLLGEQAPCGLRMGVKGSGCYCSLVPSAKYMGVKLWTSLGGHPLMGGA